MYNRYVSTDHGAYAPIPEEQPFRTPPPPHDGTAEPPMTVKTGGRSLEVLKDLWNTLSDRLHLDTGDLLLLALLYFLYREDADPELLIALGLLLVL